MVNAPCWWMLCNASSHIFTTVFFKSFKSVLTNGKNWLLLMTTRGCFSCWRTLLMSCSFCWKPQCNAKRSIVYNHSFLTAWNITVNLFGGVAGHLQCMLPGVTGHCLAQGEQDCPVQHLFFSRLRSCQSVSFPLSQHSSEGLSSSLWWFVDVSLSLSPRCEAARRKSPRCPAVLLQQIAVATDTRWRCHAAGDSSDAYWNRRRCS